MVELHWPRNSTFNDRDRGERYPGPGTFDVPEEAVEHYLTRGWKRPDSESDSESDTDDPSDSAGEGDDSEQEQEQEQEQDGEDVGEDVGEGDGSGEESWSPTRSDLESMSYNRLQSLAMESDRDDIDGRSSKEAIINALAPDGDASDGDASDGDGDDSEQEQEG